MSHSNFVTHIILWSLSRDSLSLAFVFMLIIAEIPSSQTYEIAKEVRTLKAAGTNSRYSFLLCSHNLSNSSLMNCSCKHLSTDNSMSWSWSCELNSAFPTIRSQKGFSTHLKAKFSSGWDWRIAFLSSTKRRSLR